MPSGKRRHIVIVGAGFGGLNAAKALRNADVDVTLIDKTNHHLFQPLLYQVATAALSPGDIAQPVRSTLRHSSNIHVVMSTVMGIDLNNRRVMCDDGQYTYDALILAPGTRHAYFGHDEWEEMAPGLKNLEDALRIRERMLATFEEAENAIGTPLLAPLLTFVVVGGGPTGVELAGAISEIALRTMLPDFPKLRRKDITIVLLEGGVRLLPSFDATLSERAKLDLEKLGTSVQLNTSVTNVNDDGVMLADGIFIRSRNIIWAAGNAASPVLAMAGIACDKQGRAIVQSDCSVSGHDNVFVIGDAAHFESEHGTLLPGVAQVAIQQSVFVARLLGKYHASTARPRFQYKDKGSVATIGRAKAVAEIKGLKFTGFIAWMMWALIHIAVLVSFRNRIKVMVEWIWYYVSFQPGARLITRSGADREVRSWLGRQSNVKLKEPTQGV